MNFDNGMLLEINPKKSEKGDLVRSFTLPPAAPPINRPASSVNPVLSSFRPLGVVAQFFGLFPVGGLFNESAHDLRIWHPLFRLIIPTALLALTVPEMVLMILDNVGDPTRKYIILCGLMARFPTVAGIVHFWVKAPALARCFQKWEERPLLSDTSARGLRRLGYWLLTATLVITLTYVFADIWRNRNVVARKITESPAWSACLPYLRPPVHVLEAFTFSYIHLFGVFLQRALRLAYKELSDDIAVAVVGDQRTDGVDAVVTRLRLRHEHIRRILLDVNSVMSPLLVPVFLTDAVLMCYYLFKGVQCLSYDYHDGLSVDDLVEYWPMILMCALRGVALSAHCVTATFVGHQASGSLHDLYQAPLSDVTPKTRFQLRLLESKMTNCPIVLTASGFAVINNDFLFQILCIVATYVLFMIQFQY